MRNERGCVRWVRNFGNVVSERREQMEKQRRKREENRKNERDEREISGEIGVNFFFFFCNTMNSTILCLELYCSSIAKKFAILLFTIP